MTRTGNALDKMGNAIKKGDVSGLVKQFRDILEGVEDRLDDISGVFEDAIENGKKDMQRDIAQIKRRLVRETRAEMEELFDSVRREGDGRHAGQGGRDGRRGIR